MTTKKILAALFALTAFAQGAHAAGDDSTTVLLKQGDAAVTLADVDGFLQQQVPPDKREGFLSAPKRVNQMLIQILRDKQLAIEAVAMKIDQQPQTQHQIAFVRDEVLSQQRMAAWQASLKTPSFDEQAKEEYLAHKADFAIPENVGVKQVLITTKGRTDTDAKALAEKVRAEAMANPGAFDDLVQKYSEDPSKDLNGGQVPNATSSQYMPEFVAAAKDLTAVGAISPVTKTTYGYHVLKLISRVPAKQKDFAEVKGQIVAKLKQNYVDEQRRLFLAKLDDAPASADPAGMQAFSQRYHLGATEDIGEAIKARQAESGKAPDNNKK
jgi:parvulin-like peptidyl-prolyl isomerase